MNEIIRGIMDRDIPMWALVGVLFTIVLAWSLDKIGQAAAKISGITYERQAGLVADLEARILSLIRERDHERERASHEAASRDAADKMMHAALAEQESLMVEIRRLNNLIGRQTGEFPALPPEDA